MVGTKRYRNANYVLKALAAHEMHAYQAFQQQSGLEPVVSRILWGRGIRSVQAVLDLQRNDQTLSRPYELPDMGELVALLRTARRRQQHVRVYGDYDADGVTATAVMVRGLQWAGFEHVDYYIPNRFDEGYGLHADAVDLAVQAGVDVMVTVDCGSSSPDAAQLARQKGLTLAITDHHALPLQLPDVSALVNPERMAQPNRLSGAGVALQVVRAMLDDEVPDWFYAVAAIGTVADVVPLRGDNRLIVRKGLQALQKGVCVGVDVLLGDRIKDRQQIVADDLAFFVGPHLNASGRMGDARPAVALLLAESREEASHWAQDLKARNQLRREIEKDLVNQALNQVPLDGSGQVPGFVVVAGDHWHHGVIGIVASRLKDRLKRPVAVIGWDGETGKGSARSVEGLDLFQHLWKNRDVFLKLGGHRGACGFSLSKQDPYRLSQIFSEALPEDVVRQQFVGTAVDAVVDASELTPRAVEQLLALEPYGHHFERPRLAVHGVVDGWRTMGSDAAHLSLTLVNHPYRVVAFGQAQMAQTLVEDGPVEFIGSLMLNQFQGKKTAQWQVEEFVGVAAGRKSWRQAVRFEAVTKPLSGRVLYIVNSTREQKAWASQLGAQAWYHYWPDGAWVGHETAVQNQEMVAIVVNQWDRWPRLFHWADHIVWLTAPVHHMALRTASALLKEPAGVMWISPDMAPEPVIGKARRLYPTREKLARLWKAWERGQAPLLIGGRVFHELGFQRGCKPAERRALSFSPAYQRAQQHWRAIEQDWQKPLKDWE
ncbi:MAG: single-stranded-DNA-specific exonuclease RecJ [Sulfobacillus thermosulfidooxidans]|nr:MAG: single-stranded-DNA-specific exonuclease RecJ [Sulfobacillus thermosulfidooxidans]